MNKACQDCKQQFQVRDQDLIFYGQVKVPSPNFCPDCRAMRRLAFRNERALYKRQCDLCQNSGISIYPPNTTFPVYCYKCWWSDSWDPASYAMDWNPSIPFFEQLKLLKNKVPRTALIVINSINSDYTNNAEDNKNCYLLFAAGNNEDCMYGRLVQRCKNSLDCTFLYDSELCYECVDTRKSFRCMHGERLQECVEVLFSFDMRNCQNCILCTNGRNLNYCIENKQCTKEEFEKKKAEIFSSHESLKQAQKRYEELRSQALVKYANATKCHNASGDYMYNCFDGVHIFDAYSTKNCSYVADVDNIIDCFDCNNTYTGAERCYNVMGNLSSNNNVCTVYPMYCNDVHYSDICLNCQSCFGCVGLNNKKYCVLNKEYSKEEYEKLKAEIIEQMKRDNVYGDFFPPDLSPFGYNETLAQEYYPLTEQEARERGFNWQIETSGTFDKETMSQAQMPQRITEVTDKILEEILVCADCKKNFRITQNELSFYRRMGIPLPRKDFECRHQDRMKKRNPRALWHRSCMCDVKKHPLHEGKKCENEFETSYSPERTEKIFCESCYQQEVS